MEDYEEEWVSFSPYSYGHCALHGYLQMRCKDRFPGGAAQVESKKACHSREDHHLYACEEMHSEDGKCFVQCKTQIKGQQVCVWSMCKEEKGGEKEVDPMDSEGCRAKLQGKESSEKCDIKKMCLEELE